MTDSVPQLLLIDDDTDLCELLAEYLSNEGFQLAMAHDAEQAAALLQQQSFDLMVLDIMMPGRSGLEFLQSIRPANTTPVIMLTGRGDEIDRILGLEMGADDYLAKPCNPRELLARVRAVLRRVVPTATSHVAESVLQLADLQLDAGRREAALAGNPLELTSAEFNVLQLLMKQAGQVVSKADLTEKVLHRKLTAYDRAIDVHVSRVRQKLARIDSQREFIKTIRGEGYQLLQVEP